jgi:hypothetical protein
MNFTEIRNRYTRVIKIGNKWNTYLKIDEQDFRVAQQTTYRRAQWHGIMLALALQRMLNHNKSIGRNNLRH